ncbi:MAG: hypothetical protein EOP53_03430 [Sphingobacteriales bacterium]|nr:MAG: hypothetical protein EOP53_03430 [Sphingobacteriales bacterium]
MKKTIKKSIAVLSLVVLSALPLSIYAQGPDPGCDPCCEPGAPPPTPGSPCEGVICPAQCVPIDGGLSLLIAAGIGLGARRAYKRKKQSL